MAAGKLDLYIEQGTTFKTKLTFKDANEVLIDISSWSFAGQIRRTYDATSILASFAFAIQNQITNTGEVIVSLTNTQTSGIPAEAAITNYAYDIEATISGEVRRMVEGKVKFSAEVTR